jgi:hypothetical protein
VCVAADVYVQQLGGTYHDDFYTDETIKEAYKNFVKTFVERYADDETIMAWELCNECRCAGSGTLKESGNCNTTTLTDWMTEMSAYIKTLDANHLVASGSEGFMNTDSSVYLYSGPSGVDFDANLAIDSIDYGTYHAYPDSWGVDESEYQSWGVQWIQDHAASGVTAGKPVVMEEYGVKTLNASIYQAWSDAVCTAKSSMQYWQFGVSSLSTADDGYTIYDTDELFTTVIAPAAEEFAELGGTSTSSAAATTATTTSSTSASVAGDASESVDTTASTDSSIATTSSAAFESTSSAATSTTASTEASSAAMATATESSSAISAATAGSAEASTGTDTSSALSAGSTVAATTDASSTTDAVTDAPVTTIATTTDTASDRCSVRRRRRS